MVGSYFLFCTWVAVIFFEDWSYSKSEVVTHSLNKYLLSTNYVPGTGWKWWRSPVGFPQEAQSLSGQREVGSCPQKATWGHLPQFREERWDAFSHQRAALLTLVLRLGGTQINRICFPGALSLHTWYGKFCNRVCASVGKVGVYSCVLPQFIDVSLLRSLLPIQLILSWIIYRV